MWWCNVYFQFQNQKMLTYNCGWLPIFKSNVKDFFVVYRLYICNSSWQCLLGNIYSSCKIPTAPCILHTLVSGVHSLTIFKKEDMRTTSTINDKRDDVCASDVEKEARHYHGSSGNDNIIRRLLDNFSTGLRFWTMSYSRVSKSDQNGLFIFRLHGVLRIIY